MEIVAILGVDSGAVGIMEEVCSLTAVTVGLNGVFHTDAAFWGKDMLKRYVIQDPAGLVNVQYDKLIVFGEPVSLGRMIPEIVERYGLEPDRVVAYPEWMRYNMGPHQIDWDRVDGQASLLREIQSCGDLNPLEEFYYKKPHRFMEKYAHYFEVYDRHFHKYRNTDCVIVEVGVFRGGSLQMWKDYFGSKAQIIGVDIDEGTTAYAEDQISIEIGSQSDREFWRRFREKYPRVDIFIDDGGHTMDQQAITFEEMFGHVSENGVYLCEDLHTSYWKEYGGGYQNPDSFIENSKNFIDCIHAWYNSSVYENEYTRSIQSIHYYDSILVLEKRKMDRCGCITIGE